MHPTALRSAWFAACLLPLTLTPTLAHAKKTDEPVPQCVLNITLTDARTGERLAQPRGELLMEWQKGWNPNVWSFYPRHPPHMFRFADGKALAFEVPSTSHRRDGKPDAVLSVTVRGFAAQQVPLSLNTESCPTGSLDLDVAVSPDPGAQHGKTVFFAEETVDRTWFPVSTPKPMLGKCRVKAGALGPTWAGSPTTPHFQDLRTRPRCAMETELVISVDDDLASGTPRYEPIPLSQDDCIVSRRRNRWIRADGERVKGVRSYGARHSTLLDPGRWFLLGPGEKVPSKSTLAKWAAAAGTEAQEDANAQTWSLHRDYVAHCVGADLNAALFALSDHAHPCWQAARKLAVEWNPAARPSVLCEMPPMGFEVDPNAMPEGRVDVGPVLSAKR
ncbi:hypothetical protein [Pseudomarimonas arenosa]|uniref:Uncharacterized protein n=1 Tax=Pseudomarimonas arenosa TaxID=2774145 RepID=A0AAW3ZNG6_9GAMM|nr:hypothetical protein [Pseudomarimonas arenosa]MBD8527273.1 hypothetical protein [Pseudomarimonas arenosa]